MANEFQLLENPTNVPEAVSTGYQRQNTNLFSLQTGLDTTTAVITDNGNTILVYGGGIVEVNGSLFKLINDVSIPIPNINNDYFIFVHDNGDGTADLDLSNVYPAFIPSKNGWYTSDNERVLNNFYMRKILVKKDANNENIGAVNFIDLETRPITSYALTSLATARYQLAAATLGDGSVLFGGGNSGSGNAAVDKYDTDGVQTILTSLSVARGWLAAGSLGGGSVLFGGGITGTSSHNATVDKYNIDGVRTTLTSLSVARGYLAAGSLGDGSVLFGGGLAASSNSAVVDKYDINGVRTTLTILSVRRTSLAAATLGDGSVLFGGGHSGIISSYSAVVDKYDINGVRTTLTNLSMARYQLAAATLGDGSVLFGGGSNSSGSATVDKYDINGVRTTLANLSEARAGLAAATLGGVSVLFGGGSGIGFSSIVDEYSNAIELSLPFGSKYRFKNDTAEKTVKFLIKIATPNRGYVRYNGTSTI
jgi:hypothetical protein